MKTGLVTFVSILFSFNTFASQNFTQFEQLFSQWRSFEVAPLFEGAPDYRQQTFKQRHGTWKDIKRSLIAFDKSNWSTAQQIDWFVMLAELNGYDFNQRVLKPWQRDPAFYKQVWTYKSDVPAHEGPTPHFLTELWTYSFPLSETEQNRLTTDLSRIPPFLDQARENLTGNARELWIAGIRDIQEQFQALEGVQQDIATLNNNELSSVLQKAALATQSFIKWLEQQSESKTGPSGIGEEHYSWYQQHVHLVPMTWKDEERLLKRELERAWSSLKLEEHRNINLPQLMSVKNKQEYDELAIRSANNFLKFLDEKQIVTVADYFKPALFERLGSFVPVETRHFFYIGSHFDPTPLYSHFYHWFELARMENEPNSRFIRRDALLYNIFDSRNEGTATAVEEIFMHAGLYDNNPRAREIVWIMLAQRAARGLGSLYAHANQMTMEDAGKIHMNYTPRGWMKTEPDLLIFEQHLYLRQPGYGTSYVTGKSLLDDALMEKAKLAEENGNPFVLKTFFDELNQIGNIPMSLGTWQMTGKKPKFLEEVEKAAKSEEW
ncbi:DUF885 domain-containing protein [Aliiglaciecola sp. M165]|uniref:DUF885 domain-containing protein n=1 Tax=Aliiglaciecola sp. M165 TaxID=2593649 RepID=UPI00117D5E89|nr:DUF885 domain-containing protein [Aliiglaciecola sp. M165]TRY30144.1 DUF885 domain-containing protein [Aliiglaciecola sp. M165]